jgi:hypothetical protein
MHKQHVALTIDANGRVTAVSPASNERIECEARSDATSPKAEPHHWSGRVEDTSLIALAAWLHRQATQAQATAESDADENSALASLEAAARLAQASRVVKEAADQERGGNKKPKPFAANQA